MSKDKIDDKDLQNISGGMGIDNLTHVDGSGPADEPTVGEAPEPGSGGGVGNPGGLIPEGGSGGIEEMN